MSYKVVLFLLWLLLGSSHNGAHIISLIVSPFKSWLQTLPLRYQHTKDVCPFIAYSVTELETVFCSLIFLAIFVHTANSAK